MPYGLNKIYAADQVINSSLVQQAVWYLFMEMYEISHFLYTLHLSAQR